jgi:hypothetical protein
MRRMRLALVTAAAVACGVAALAISSAGTPSAASAAPAPPAAATGSASNVAQSSATVTGALNPNGTDTQYHFEYGTTTAYGSNTASTGAGAGTARVAASADLTGLKSATAYHYRLVAASSAGTTDGADQTFTTTTPPTVTTGGANVAQTSANLSGTVDPNGQDTTYYFRYGTTASYGLQTSPASAGSGNGSVGVHATVFGLTSSAVYHYQLVAQSPGGTSFGNDQTFTTTSSQTVVLGHEGFVSPGSIIGVEIGCFHGTSTCTGHVTMTHNGAVIGQRDYSIAPDSGGFQNMALNQTGKNDLGQNGVFHLLAVTVNVAQSDGQKLSYVIHLARWVWH